MSEVAIYPLTGTFRSEHGPVTVNWPDIEILHLDGREIAKIKTWPGAPIGIMPGVVLTAAEKEAIALAVAKVRGGVRPCAIHCQEALYEILEGGDEENDGDDE